jgi:hypothetical protein
MDFKDVACVGGGTHWLDWSGQDRDMWPAFVKAAMKLRVP